MSVTGPALAEGELFRESPRQRAFVDAALSGDYHYLMYGGGIRSGKSFAGIATLNLLCYAFPGSRWAIVRKDLPTIRRNVLPTFEKLRPAICGKVNMSDWTATWENGSQVIFFPESLQEDPDLNRWKGLEVNGFLLEEANELALRSFHKAQERAGSWIIPRGGKQPPRLVLMTCNPSPLWVKTMFYDPYVRGELEKPYFFQPATAADNPYLPPDYVEGLKDLPPLEYKRFVEGDWSVLAGQFFDGLRYDQHFVPQDQMVAPADLPDWWEYWSGYDWGYRHNAVLSSFAKDGDGNVVVLDTLYMHRLSDDDQASLVAETVPARCLRVVYAGQDAFNKQQAHAARVHSVADVFGQYRVFLKPANTARVQGWAAVQRGFAGRKGRETPLLRFYDTPGNRRLFDDLSALTANPTRDNDTVKIDADEYGVGGDDGPDALRYGVVSALTEWSKPRDHMNTALAAENTHTGFDYAKATRKPTRVQQAVNAWRKELKGGSDAWTMERVGTPGL